MKHRRRRLPSRRPEARCPGLDGVPCGAALPSQHRGYCREHHAAYQRRWRRARTEELHALRAQVAKLAG